MYCVDANVWIYFFDSELDEHVAVYDDMVSAITEQPLFTTTVLQMEVVHYFQRQLSDSESAIDRFLRLGGAKVAELTDEDITSGVEILREHEHSGIGGRDATVLAAMDRNGITELWTHDDGLKRVGQRLDWLTVTDPVEESALP